MSKYTTEVRYICEQANGLDSSVGFADVDQIIAGAIPSVFSFDFPVFDPSYKSVLCTKILRHYYTREIGFETVGLWKLKLQTKLNEIMPFYNQLYESELIKFNPLYDSDLHTTHVGDKSSENNREESKTGISSGNSSTNQSGSVNTNAEAVEGNTATGTSKSDMTGAAVENASRQSDRADHDKIAETTGNTHYDLFSETPQGALDGVEDGEYLTNARKITDAGSKTDTHDSTGTAQENSNSNSMTENNQRNSYDESTEKTNVSNENQTNNSNATTTDSRNNLENSVGKDKFNSTESYVLHVMGKQSGASFSHMLTEFRETFLNIDMEVIDSLSDLFYNLW